MLFTYPDKVNRPNIKFPKILQSFSIFFKNTSGATGIEYALIIAGIVVAIVVSVSALGKLSNDSFKKVAITAPGSQTGDKGGGSGGNDAGGSSGGGGSGGNDAGGSSGGGGSGGNDTGGSSGGGGSGGGSDDGGGSGGGSGDGGSGRGAMYEATGSIIENQDNGIAGGSFNSGTSSYVSGSNSRDKGENSVGSVGDGNKSDNSNKKLAKNANSFKLWLFPLILVFLGTLMFYISKKKQ